MNKKGVGIVFNWLFAIIVGVSIFLLLVGFAVKNTDLFGKVTGQEIVELLDTSFTDFKSNSVGTLVYFDGDIELDFSCKNSKENILINGKNIDGGTRLKGNIVFAPDNMKDNEFALWSVPWKVPFRVTNFIFLSDKTYMFTGNVHDRITRDLPIIKGVGIFDTNDDAGEVIDFREGERVDYCGDTKKISYILDTQLDEFYGELCIGGSKINYVGNAMLYGYIFSDQDEFLCLMDLANEKAEIIADIYERKAEAMDSGGNCVSRELDDYDARDIRKVRKIIDENNLRSRGSCGRLLF